MGDERGEGIQARLEDERFWRFKRAMKQLQKYWKVYGGPVLLMIKLVPLNKRERNWINASLCNF